MSYYNKAEPEFVIDVAVDSERVALTQKDERDIDPMGTGFVWYTPPLANRVTSNRSEKKHDNCEWNIAGHDMQILTMTVPPNERIVTEVGSFMFGSGDIELNTEFTCCASATSSAEGGGSSGGCNEGCRRICGGESCVKLLLVNKGPNPGYVGLTPNFPGKILPIEFGKHIDANHALYAQNGSYMSSLGDGIQVGCDYDNNCMICCCAGFGCCRQKITGTPDDIAFIAAGGTLIYRKLEPDEVVIVDSRSIVAIEESVKLGIVSNGHLGMCCCGGEGCFSTTLTGPGKVFLQSMCFSKFQEAVQATAIDDRESAAAR